MVFMCYVFIKVNFPAQLHLIVGQQTTALIQIKNKVFIASDAFQLMLHDAASLVRGSETPVLHKFHGVVLHVQEQLYFFTLLASCDFKASYRTWKLLFQSY